MRSGAAKAALLLGLTLISGTAWALGETTRVSVATDGEQGNNQSYQPALSADGRFVAFDSEASNLVAGDTNDAEDIFVHDRLTHKIQRVSVATTGEQSNAQSYGAALSADGRFVAFDSEASNLVAGDTNAYPDIFVHDRLTHETERVSVATTRKQGNSYSHSPSLSADGRFVAFQSLASNLVEGDTNGNWDIFVHDRLTHKTQLVSVATDGEQGNKFSDTPSLSADGRFVAFESYASNLVTGDTNVYPDIFVHDRLTHETQRVSVSTDGEQGGNNSNNRSTYTSSPTLSADGRFVAFASAAYNLTAEDTDIAWDVFVHDRLTHKTQLVSVPTPGTQRKVHSYGPTLSADGRFVAFKTDDYKRVAGHKISYPVIFVYDRLAHKTQRVSDANSGGQGNSQISIPSISADGRFVAFGSDVSNLVEGDTNGNWDVFVRDRLLNHDLSADLTIEATEQPTSLVQGVLGQYTYTITNHGPGPVNSVQITHSVANGQVRKWIPSQGHCRNYTTISLCDLRTLASGASLTLTAGVKAIRKDLHQQISVASSSSDPQATNNSVNVDTPVTPR